MATGFAETVHDLVKDGFSDKAAKNFKKLPKVTLLKEFQGSRRQKRY